MKRSWSGSGCALFVALLRPGAGSLCPTDVIFTDMWSLVGGWVKGLEGPLQGLMIFPSPLPFYPPCLSCALCLWLRQHLLPPCVLFGGYAVDGRVERPGAACSCFWICV